MSKPKDPRPRKIAAALREIDKRLEKLEDVIAYAAPCPTTSGIVLVPVKTDWRGVEISQCSSKT